MSSLLSLLVVMISSVSLMNLGADDSSYLSMKIILSLCVRQVLFCKSAKSNLT